MANRPRGYTSTPRYCAEHRHDVPSFTKLHEQLTTIDDAAAWLAFEKRNAAKVTKIVVATGAVGAAMIAPMALVGTPMVGGATGALSGYSGAAAYSHGLAIWGGGSLASGGLGMAGGAQVVTALGSSLGGVLGGVTSSAYVRSDSSFRIEKLRDGEGPAVLLGSGFLTEGPNGWGPWRSMIDVRYPNSPVYRVHWGAKELKAIGEVLSIAGSKQAMQQVLRHLARKASRQAAGVPGLGTVLVASDLAQNPWSVARRRAAMTGTVLADLISRTDEQAFVLVGHSLGARVMVTTAQALGTRHTCPKLEAVHLLGAAVGSKGDWRTLNNAVRGTVWNYYSTKDTVLKALYRTAQAGQRAAGAAGFNSTFPSIRDRNVSRTVSGHSQYFTGVKLQ